MSKLRTITYVVGIVIAVSAFSLFLYSFLPHLISNDQWENMDRKEMSDVELMKEFQATPAYQAFYERYPDAKEELNNHKHGGELQVGVANFEKNNYLKLHLYFNDYDSRVNVNVMCQSSNNQQEMHADGLFALDFIEQTNCLNLVPIVENKQPTIIADGEVVIIQPKD